VFFLGIESIKKDVLGNLESIMRTIAFCQPSLKTCQSVLANRALLDNETIRKWCYFVGNMCTNFENVKPENAENLTCSEAGKHCLEAAMHLSMGDEEAYLQHCKFAEENCWQAKMRKGQPNSVVPESMHS
jgi:hypothetical protein